jgi:hypothetical protein
MSDTRMNEIPPPASFTVDHDHKPVLYQADGRALVRAAGFVPHGRMATQSTGQFPQLTTKMTAPKKTGTKKPKGKGRGC